MPQAEDFTSPLSSSVPYDFRSDPELSEKWKLRFAFYEKYGAPTGFWRLNKTFRTGLKTLGYWKRRTVILNWYAYCFGFIYLFTLGLWRKAFVSAGTLLAGIIIIFFSSPLIFPLGLASGIALFMLSIIFPFARANFWYYQLKTKGKDEWNLYLW